MSLDTKRFKETQFERRRKDFPVPQLSSWFPKGEKAIWPIQSLTGSEISRAEDLAKNSPTIIKLTSALVSGSGDAAVKKVEQYLGNTEDKPEPMAKRIYHLRFGSVPIYGKNGDEMLPLELASKICDNFPILFLDITNAIYTLSNLGFEEKKLKPSGTTQK